MRNINKQNTAKYSFAVIAMISVIFTGSLSAERLSQQSLTALFRRSGKTRYGREL